jgi:hypothetical protein
VSSVPALVLGCNALLGIRSLSFPDDAGDAGAGDALTSGEAGDWCREHAPDAVACEDFDQLDALPPPGWLTVVYGAGGEGGLDDDVYVSPPRALSIDVPALQGNAEAQWWLERPDLPSLAGTATVTLAFDVRVDSPPSGSGSYLVLGGFVFDIGSADGGASVELLYDANGLHLVQGFGVELDDYGVSTLPLGSPGTWTRVELDLTIDADDGGAWGAAAVGGVRTVFDAGAVVTLASLSGHGAPIAGVGNLITLGPTSRQVVHVDDVVVNVQR